MLGLQLRKEFQGANMPGTTIALHRSNSQGATDKAPQEFLKITYPTADLLKALRSLREGRDGGPVVLIGGRGKGKSHLMAVLHHAINSPDITEKWLENWADTLHDPSLRDLKISKGYQAISETISDNEYNTLWDLLFDRHKKGEFYKGQFVASNQHIPARSLMEQMFEEQPTCLILDEFQTWYDALPELYNGLKAKECAFSFIQMLSEISKERPEILMFIVSVRNNNSDAFMQLHRQEPMLIDFLGETAKQDRQKLILHRLFENRLNISNADISSLTATYAKERFRLLYSQKGTANAQKIADEVSACWPYSPELLNLLEDQILMTTAAQETRDMIRILARVFKSQGENTPIITSANFAVEGDSTEVQMLVDSIAQESGQEKLREIAQRNLSAIKDSGVPIPKCSEMISAIWMHSMAPGRKTGVKPPELQLALSASQIIDDNDFNLQLGQLVENSINIHSDVNNQKFWFEQSKNTKTEVRVTAKNDNLWEPSADPNNRINHPGKDIEWLMRTIRRCFVSETNQSPTDVIILGPHWNTSPWEDVEEREQPKNWAKLVLLIIPAAFIGNTKVNSTLGKWLATQVKNRRNTVRFLIQEADKGIFEDRELLFQARCSYLCSNEAWGTVQEYRALRQDFDKPLEQEIKGRFNRFAVLRKWNFQHPEQCEFEIERLERTGIEAAVNIEEAIRTNIFDLTDFQKRILNAAQEGANIGDCLDNLIDVAPGEVLAYIGELPTLEIIQDMAAKGQIALNLDGTWYAKKAGQDFESARQYIRSKTTRSGSELRKILLGTPAAAGGGSVVTTPHPAPSTPTVPAETPTFPGMPNSEPGSPNNGNGNQVIPPIPPVPPMPAIPTEQTRHAAPTNGVTLNGNFESWGLAGNKKLKSATLRIDGITVQALKSFIMRLPSANKASLDVTFDQEDN